MAEQISVLGLKLSSSPYLRSANARFSLCESPNSTGPLYSTLVYCMGIIFILGQSGIFAQFLKGMGGPFQKCAKVHKGRPLQFQSGGEGGK